MIAVACPTAGRLEHQEVGDKDNVPPPFRDVSFILVLSKQLHAGTEGTERCFHPALGAVLGCTLL